MSKTTANERLKAANDHMALAFMLAVRALGGEFRVTPKMLANAGGSRVTVREEGGDAVFALDPMPKSPASWFKRTFTKKDAEKYIAPKK